MDTDKLNASAFKVQCLAAICISFLASQTGFIAAWPSYTLENFKSNETMLSTPMTTVQGSLLGSLSSMGSLVATPFCGYTFNSLGRKYATILFGLFYVCSWAIIALTRNPILVLFALTLGGVGVAGQNVSLIYISEISHNSIRGAFTACTASGYFLGILISYTLGGYLSYHHVLYTHFGLSLVCIILLLGLKESPVYLMLVGKEKEAEASIAFYNQVDLKSQKVEIEMKKIKLQIDPRLQKLLEAENVTDIDIAEQLLRSQGLEETTPRSEPSWKIFLKSKSSKRALFTVLVLIAAIIMMGSVALQVYADSLFREAVPSLSPNLCSILLALDFLAASILSVLMIDRFGRKILMIVTALISGVCTLLLGLSMKLAPPWVTVLLIYVYSFAYTVGCGVVPFVLAAEVFLPEVRGLCNSISMGGVWVVNFITLFVFGPLVELIGLSQVFCCFSVVCFLGAAYTYFKLPETKGLSVDAIQLEFLKI